MVSVKTKCRQCGKEVILKVYKEDIVKYQNGELIQRAFPYLTAGEREMLISGICPDCWEKLWSDE